jgi:DNA-binding NtrC family response regulator
LQQDGWDVCTARYPSQARALLANHQFAAGLADCDVPGRRHVSRWQEEVLDRHRDIRWILLVAKECLECATVRDRIVDCCYDFHTLPVDCERLATTLGRASGMARLRQLAGESECDSIPIRHGIVGESPPLTRMMGKLEKAAPTDIPLLISGESGTGKELVARAAHTYSQCAAGPIVVVTCGALSPTLIHAELFGHEKGAFTGAHGRKLGHLERAHGGTLFLDEIGELAPDMQVNLLRFLQEGTLQRVGGRETIRVDVRIVAATNIDLERAVARGTFREDLYYRLNGVRLHLPPLRERGRDVEHLARHYAQRFDKGRPSVRVFSPAALAAMQRYTWPGNIRELVNRVRRGMVLSEGTKIGPSDLGFDSGETRGSTQTLDEARRSAERIALEGALVRNHDNVTRAARELGVSRVTFYRLLTKHELTGRTPVSVFEQATA